MAPNFSVMMVSFLVMCVLSVTHAVDQTCIADSSAACSAELRHSSQGMSLLQTGEVEQALLRHAEGKTKSTLARIDQVCAGQIRKFHSDPGNTGKSLLAGLQAIHESVKMFMQTPPNIDRGMSTLGAQLLVAVERLVPEDMMSVEDFSSFREMWLETFTKLSNQVEGIQQHLEDFASSGDHHKLMDAIEAALTHATSAISKFVPDETAAELVKFMEAIVDLFDGVGNGLNAYADGDTAGAIEAIYSGLRVATDSLIPAELQNDTAYKEVVGLLDGAVSNLTTNVLTYQNLIMNSSVCWRHFSKRGYERPDVCEAGYTWDGGRWCMYGTEPYTLESVWADHHYLNMHNGGSKDGTNVGMWNNPSNADTQWHLHGPAADGSYTVQNVAGGLYLNVDKGNNMSGTNLQGWSNPERKESKWLLHPTEAKGVFVLQNVLSRTYAHLDCWWCLGANVHMSTDRSSVKSAWRIQSAYLHTPLKVPATNGAGLLERTTWNKKPKGALPAACRGGLEKIGSWCYEACPEGHNAIWSRCQAECGPTHPITAPMMCGKTDGDISAAIQKMVAGTVTQIVTLSALVAAMNAGGLFVAGGLTGTMNALVEMGKPFAHPICPN